MVTQRLRSEQMFAFSLSLDLFVPMLNSGLFAGARLFWPEPTPQDSSTPTRNRKCPLPAVEIRKVTARAVKSGFKPRSVVLFPAMPVKD